MTEHKYLQISTPAPHLHEQGYVETAVGVTNPSFYDHMSPSDIIQLGWELIGSPVKFAERQWIWIFRAEIDDAPV